MDQGGRRLQVVVLRSGICGQACVFRFQAFDRERAPCWQVPAVRRPSSDSLSADMTLHNGQGTRSFSASSSKQLELCQICEVFGGPHSAIVKDFRMCRSMRCSMQILLAGSLALIVWVATASAQNSSSAKFRELSAQYFDTCMKDWDATTHMTKEQWGRTCRRLADERAKFRVEEGGKELMPKRK